MYVQNGFDAGTSPNVSAHVAVVHDPADKEFIDKHTNFAIACRCVKSVGQYNSGDAEQPDTMPLLYNFSI